MKLNIEDQYFRNRYKFGLSSKLPKTDTSTCGRYSVERWLWKSANFSEKGSVYSALKVQLLDPACLGSNLSIITY